MFASGSQTQGDTQPISQSIYDDFTSRRKEQHAIRDAPHLEHDAVDSQGNASHTFQQGQTGHIDLLGVFEQPSNIDEEDIDPLSQAPDVRADPFPEERRFKQPTTPATYGKKRKRSTAEPLQEATTPRPPINPFAGQMGNMDGMMGPSQLFKATQAHTSPLTNLVTSDGLSERPSPDMHNLQRPSTAGSLPSPARPPCLSATRAVTEPQTTYISMKESQEARERLFQSWKATHTLSPDELSDDEFGDGDTQLRRRLNQKRIDAEARKQFANLTAQSNSEVVGRKWGDGIGTRNYPTKTPPHRAGREASEPVLISDDVELQGNVTEDETEREEDVEAEEEIDVDELAEDNKENVEVPRTISRAQQTAFQIIASQPIPSYRNLRKPLRSSRTGGDNSAKSSSQDTRSQELIRAIGGGTQPDAIADSQTSQCRTKAKQSPWRTATKAVSEPPSTIDSRILVPQSQLSQAAKGVSSSDSRAETQGSTSSGHPQSSPLLAKSVQQLAASNEVSQRSKVPVNGERDITDPLQIGGSNEALPQSEAAPCTQGLPVALGQQGSSTGQASEFPALPSVPPKSTIPETSPSAIRARIIHESTEDTLNSMPSPRSTPKSASKLPPSYSVIEHSRPSTLFETAQEHPAGSPWKSLLPSIPGAQNKQSSPIKPKLLRSIGEIAADPSPPDMIGDVDVDIHILSNEDIEFQNAISGSSPISPPRKKRRAGRGHALRIVNTEPIKPLPPPLSPLHRPMNSDGPPSSAFSVITPLQTSSDMDVPSPVIANSISTRKFVAKQAQTSMARIELLQVRVTTKAASDLQQARRLATPKAGKELPKTGNKSPKIGTGEPRLPVLPEEPAVIAPNRVFAHFKGTSPGYYPATCLELIGDDEPRYRVRFEDGSVDVIGGYSIKRLELRPGDMVKVDLPGARKINYVVEAMRDRQRSTVGRDPATPSRRGRVMPTNDSVVPEIDIYGNATVLVSPKQRQPIDGDQTESSPVAVPLALIYFTQTLWTSLRERQYTHTHTQSKCKPHIPSSLKIPSEGTSTPSTPSSRTRRAKTYGLAQARPTNGGSSTNGGIFRNMAFALTNVSGDNERIKNHVKSNGGHVLNTGLNELFHVPTLPRTTSSSDPNADASFHLAPAAEDLGFTCLIADKHCRTAKFIQALSLGIPCLSTRWITNCVAKQRVLPWEPYLLPSGESAFLGGAVRSRVLQPFDAETSTLRGIVDNRPKMLNGASVLVIMEKGQEKVMHQHPLITHALGASKVSRAVSDASAAKAVADAAALGEPWDWVFSYDKEEEVEKKLFGGSRTGKKRKRGRESDVCDLTPGKKTRTRVVGNEFVIQSLILGMLVDE